MLEIARITKWDHEKNEGIAVLLPRGRGPNARPPIFRKRKVYVSGPDRILSMYGQVVDLTNECVFGTLKYNHVLTEWATFGDAVIEAAALQQLQPTVQPTAMDLLSRLSDAQKSATSKAGRM